MRISLMIIIVFVVGLCSISGCSRKELDSEAESSTPSGSPADQLKTATPQATTTPEAKTVPVILLGDKRCSEPSCATRGPLNSLKVMIPDLKITELDWSTPEGKKAYKEHGLQYLPAFIFDASLQGEEKAMKRLARSLKPSDKQGYKILQMGTTHDPTKEICDNKVDDTANGKSDCDDDDCKASLTCRPEIKGDLQVFVMSQCPYGVKALDAMREVLDAFGNEIKFDVHFIANEDGDGFRSLHGQPEVDENIRELCAKKLAPTKYKWMEYIWCRDKDIRSTSFGKCVKAAGIRPAAFNACATGEDGKRLLREDIDLAQSLGFSGSPSWLVNNKTKFSGIDPKTIQTGICRENPDFKGCKAQLTGPAPRKGGGCGSDKGGGGKCGC